MDRRRFLLGGTAGLTLLAGCTREELERAEQVVDDSQNDDPSSESGGDSPSGNDSKPATKTATVPEGAGLVTVESDESFDTAITRITETIEGNDALTLVATVDHAANAESAGMKLPPTTLFVFGNPELGTPLMQESRSVAIDLPQKMLVWEDETGVYITYNDPQYLAARHGIDNQDEIISQIAGALDAIATGSKSK